MKTVQECKKIIKSYLQKSFENETYDIDVEDLASAISLKIQTDDFSETTKYPEGTLGSLHYEKSEGKYICTVKKGITPTKKKFTIAHEIAHYILHRYEIAEQGIIEDAYLRNPNFDTELEIEANELALDIILPLGFLIPLLKEHTIESLTKLFNVNKTDIINRLGLTAEFENSE